MDNRIIQHNVTEPWPLADKSVHCIVTSPPYFLLRNYGVAGQVGLEKTLPEYIKIMVSIFREAWRVLRDDGTLWLNMGDSYASAGGTRSDAQATAKSGLQGGLKTQLAAARGLRSTGNGIKTKDLMMVPARLAIALQDDGWYIRSDIIWAKKNCMPESVTDRPTKAHEHIFLLTKSDKYFYDHIAIREPAIYDVDGTGTEARKARQKEGNKSMPSKEQFGVRPTKAAGSLNPAAFEGKHSDKQSGHGRRHAGFNERCKAAKGNRKTFRGGGTYTEGQSFENSAAIENDSAGYQPNRTGMRNKRDVWHIATAQFPEAHFATFPKELPFVCISAGTSSRGCCMTCGEPYRRQLKPTEAYAEVLKQGSYHDHAANLEEGMGQVNGEAARRLRAAGLNGSDYETTGWTVSCSCNAEVIPCTVLDPFVGSGTTMEVGIGLGRSAIGLELNPKYIVMANKRLKKALGMFL